MKPLGSILFTAVNWPNFLKDAMRKRKGPAKRGRYIAVNAGKGKDPNRKHLKQRSCPIKQCEFTGDVLSVTPV